VANAFVLSLSQVNQPICIGIAGPSCSGKTTVARRLAQLLPGEATLFGLDAYYADLSQRPYEDRRRFNFDEPAALEDQLLTSHLEALRRGEAIRRPVYDFPTHSRLRGCFEDVRPGNFLIVEGLFTFYWPGVRDVFHLKAFLSAPDTVCLERRKERDIRERGRTVEFVLQQYDSIVRPGNENYIAPTRQYADLVLSGEQPIEESAHKIFARVMEFGN
jgi:uridine kinase